MRRLKTASTIVVLTAIAALFLTSLVWSAEDESGSILAAARSVVRPGIKRINPVRITGQIKKGLSKADVSKMTAPQQDSRGVRVPKAKLPTVEQSTSILKKMRGGQELLKSVPVPESDSLPDNANLLLTPLNPRGSLRGAKSAYIWLNGVWMGYDGTSLERSASQDRVCIRSAESGGAVAVVLSDMEPGWYIVAGDFVARTDGTHGLQGAWRLVQERKAGAFEISSTLKRGSELFLPVMLQLTRSNRDVYVFFYPNGEPIWFRSVSVQKLN